MHPEVKQTGPGSCPKCGMAPTRGRSRTNQRSELYLPDAPRRSCVMDQAPAQSAEWRSNPARLLRRLQPRAGQYDEAALDQRRARRAHARADGSAISTLPCPCNTCSRKSVGMDRVRAGQLRCDLVRVSLLRSRLGNPSRIAASTCLRLYLLNWIGLPLQCLRNRCSSDFPASFRGGGRQIDVYFEPAAVSSLCTSRTGVGAARSKPN